MNIYYDKRFESEPSGFHPYEGGTSPSVHYYDFKKHQELISTVLEDFVGWSDREAIKSFYELLGWLNGPDSLLESSDCAFAGPRPETSDRWEKSLVVSGRLLVLYRDESLNLHRPNMMQLNEAVHHYLEQLEPDLSLQQASVGTTIVSTTYSRMNRMGYRYAISFWAWGDSDDEAFDNLHRLFQALRECLERVSQDIKIGPRK